MSKDLKNKNRNLINWLVENNIDYLIDFELKKKSWLKCGGIAKLFIEPDTVNKTENLGKYLIKEKMEYYPIGNLSNTLIRDGEIYTPIINLKRIKDPIIKLEDNSEYILLKVSSGLSIFKFISHIISNFKISGLEGMIGIPGTIGGAMITNASSYDSCISDFLTKVNYVNEKGEIISILKKDINFNWRSSIFKKMNNFLITEVFFRFPKKNIKNINEIQQRVNYVKNHRETFQEKKFPNLGSLYATKNLYYDLSKLSISLFLLYVIYILGTKFVYIFLDQTNLLKFRKLIVKLYCLYFKIPKNKFSMSSKTINCLVNIGSSSANDAIETIQILEKKIKGRIKLENVILKDLK